MGCGGAGAGVGVFFFTLNPNLKNGGVSGGVGGGVGLEKENFFKQRI